MLEIYRLNDKLTSVDIVFRIDVAVTLVRCPAALHMRFKLLFVSEDDSCHGEVPSFPAVKNTYSGAFSIEGKDALKLRNAWKSKNVYEIALTCTIKTV